MKPYYEASGITIYHGSNLDVLPAIEGCDHIITDPPYSDTTHEGARSATASRTLVDFASTTADGIRTVLSLARPSRWCVATVDWRHLLPLEIDPPFGLRFVRFGVWIKPNGAPQFTGDRPATGWEAVGIWHRAGVPMTWNRGGHHAVWTFNKESGDHPTQKAVALVQKFVSDFTDPGDIVLDPWMGSGTTLVAAKNLGRRAIGIEIEERYCEIAAKRLRQEMLPGVA